MRCFFSKKAVVGLLPAVRGDVSEADRGDGLVERDEKSQVIAEQSQHQNLRVSSSKKTDTNFAIKKYFPIKSNKSNEALLMFAAKKAGEI